MCFTLNCAEILHSTYQYKLERLKKIQTWGKTYVFWSSKREKYTYKILAGKLKRWKKLGDFGQSNGQSNKNCSYRKKRKCVKWTDTDKDGAPSDGMTCQLDGRNNKCGKYKKNCHALSQQYSVSYITVNIHPLGKSKLRLSLWWDNSFLTDETRDKNESQCIRGFL